MGALLNTARCELLSVFFQGEFEVRALAYGAGQHIHWSVLSLGFQRFVLLFDLALVSFLVNSTRGVLIAIHMLWGTIGS